MINRSLPWAALLAALVTVPAYDRAYPDERRAQDTASAVSVGKWSATTPFDSPRTSHQSVLHRGFLYVIGGYSYKDPTVTTYDDVQFAAVAPAGTIAKDGWKSTTKFKNARSGHSCVVYKDRLYLVAGGNGADYYADTQYARLEKDGTIAEDGWQQSPNRLNVPRSVHASFVALARGKPYLYVVGGVGDVDKKTVHFDTVEFAPIAEDGSVGKWTLSASKFKKGRSAPGVAVVNGRLYVIGGWGDALTDIFGDVQSAPLKEDGDVGEWSDEPNALATGRYGHTTVVLSDKGTTAVVILGGNAGQGNYLNEIQYTLLRGGKPGPWQKLPAGAQFPTPRWGHTSVLHSGSVFVIGGSGKGVFLNDVQHAPLALK